MHLRFTGRAKADLDALHAYVAERNPRAATRLVDRILAAAYNLEDFPFLGRPGRVEGTREFVVPATPYILVYTVTDAYHLTLHRILHGAMKYPPADEGSD